MLRARSCGDRQSKHISDMLQGSEGDLISDRGVSVGSTNREKVSSGTLILLFIAVLVQVHGEIWTDVADILHVDQTLSDESRKPVGITWA